MIYLDNAATTPLDSDIITAYHELLQKYYANAASHHLLGSVVDRLQERARQQIGQLFSAKADEIIFTSGASEANNLAIKGVAFQYVNRGKHIITSCVEHPSVLNTCLQLVNEFGYEVTYLAVDEKGKIQLEDLRKALRKDTILVSIMSVNNEMGACNDLENIAAIIKENSRAFFHSDMTQSIGKIAFDYTNVDLISCSAHKIHGLKGSGLLVKRHPIQLVSQICGGGQEFGFRAGTSNWPVNVMFAKTLRLAFEQVEKNKEHVQKLHQYAQQHLLTLPDIVINSPIDCSPYILNFSVCNHRASVIVQALEEQGICLSTLSACSSKLHKPSIPIFSMFQDETRALSAIRLSFSKYTTKEEIETFTQTLTNAMQTLK